MPTRKTKPDSRAPKERRSLPPPEVALQPVGNRWAVIVGISKYEHESLNLDYAADDAEELYELICSPRAGAFDESRVRKLINGQATTAGVTDALRSFLQGPESDDIVLIYFSCHGGPDPNRLENLYLLTHNADPSNIAGTALPMRELRDALRDNLRAKRVVILVDACHGGAAVGGIKGGLGSAELVNRYISEMAKAQPGLAMLTSARANEAAKEDARWGGGHGVFTYCLLEGLRGKAERDGMVRVGDLFEYVRRRVLEETGQQQHPVIGPDSFDPELPLAVTGDISAKDHAQLGQCLHHLGAVLRDPRRSEAALRHLDEALQLADFLKERPPGTLVHKGLALMALGRNTEAAGTFREAAGLDDPAAAADARFHLCAALARERALEESVAAVDEFLAHHPDDARAAWLRRLRAGLQASLKPGAKRAMLIGIQSYSWLKLRGVHDDINAVHKLLSVKFGVEDIEVLLDDKATRQGILDALQGLKGRAEAGDRVIIYYTAMGANEPPYCLVPSDFDTDKRTGAISAQELHDLLRSIPAGRVTVLLDTIPNGHLLDLARQDGGYDLYLAAEPGQLAYEIPMAGGFHGLFTYALLQELARAQDAPLGDLHRRVAEWMQSHNPGGPDRPQQPVFVADEAQPLFGSPGHEQYLAAYDLTLRRSFADLTAEDLGRWSQRVAGQPLPGLAGSIGRGFLEKGDFEQAAAALENAPAQSGGADPEATLSLGLARLRTQRYPDALQCLRDYAAAAPEHAAALAEPLQIVEALGTRRVHALLVGVGWQRASELPYAGGVPSDSDGMHRVLVERLGLAKDDIQVLANREATGPAIREAFGKLAETARREPALFYFAGNGSHTGDGRPTLLGFDARTAPIPNDVLLEELAQMAGSGPTNLVAIVDAGFRPGLELPWGGTTWGSRYIPPDPRDMPATRPIRIRQKEGPPWEAPAEWKQQRAQLEAQLSRLRIGRATLYPASIGALFPTGTGPSGAAEPGRSGEGIVEAEFPSPFDPNDKAIYGALSWALIKCLLSLSPQELTFAALRQVLEQELKWLQPCLLCARPEERFLSNAVQEEQVQLLIRDRIERAPIRQAVELLKRQMERSGKPDPDSWRELGIAHLALGEHSDAARALDMSIKLREDGRDPDAHYYLGRALFESGDNLGQAIGELEEALEQQKVLAEETALPGPPNVPVYYYLGQAIRTQAAQSQQKAADALSIYLARGAPLGHRDEVKAYLDGVTSYGTGPGTG